MFESNLVKEIQPIIDIYPVVAIEKAKAPYAVYNAYGGEEEKHLTGWTGLKKKEYEIDIYCKTYKELKAKENEVINKLKSFLFTYVNNITIEEPIETYEKEIRLHCANINFRIQEG